MDEIQVWEVEYGNDELTGEHPVVYVEASNITDAVNRAMVLMQKNKNYHKPERAGFYVKAASFSCTVYKK